MCNECKIDVNDFDFITHVNFHHIVGHYNDEDSEEITIIQRKKCYCNKRFPLYDEFVIHFVKFHMEIMYVTRCGFRSLNFNSAVEHVSECRFCIADNDSCSDSQSDYEF